MTKTVSWTTKTYDCPECSGKGHTGQDNAPCEACLGHGKLKETRTVTIEPFEK